MTGVEALRARQQFYAGLRAPSPHQPRPRRLVWQVVGVVQRRVLVRVWHGRPGRPLVQDWLNEADLCAGLLRLQGAAEAQLWALAAGEAGAC